MLDMNGLFVAVSITISLIGAFSIGRMIGVEQERDRIVRSKRNTDKTRRAS
jgi:hypothetical protein